MQERSWTDFSGISGRVINGAFGFRSLFTGIILTILVVIIAKLTEKAGSPNASFVMVELLFALVFARFALNGLHGEFAGSLISTSGGPWSAVIPVALRHVTLSLLWLAPLFLLGHNQVGPDTAMAMTMGMGSGGALLVIGIYIFLSILTPPIFLAVSVRASEFSDIFSADHWRDLFRGRLDDLKMIYVLYLGALAFVVFLTFPFVLLLSIKAPKTGTLLGLFALCFLFGFGATVLGRLVGFFAFGEFETAGSPEDLGTSEVPDVSASAVASVTGGNPPLENAIAVVGGMQRLFEQDPQAALEELTRVRATHAPHPLILIALTRMQYQTGNEAEAVELARETIDVCLRGGVARPAADLIGEMWPLIGKIKPTKEQLGKLAHLLIPDGDLTVATRAFVALLRDDPWDSRSIKGLMKIAEFKMQNQQSPEEAIQIYEFLMRHCSASPLAEYFSQGLEEARRVA
jgi:hypothetical protein